MELNLEDLSTTAMELLCDARAREQQKKLQLEVEEAGRQIASCRGEIAGIRQMFSYILESKMMSEDLFRALDRSEFMPDIGSMSDEDIREHYFQAKQLQQQLNYKAFLKLVLQEVENKKNYLFFEADKARDIDFVHGYRDGILRFSNTIESIEREKKRREDEMTLFARSFE